MFRQVSLAVVILMMAVVASVGAQTPPPSPTPVFDIYHFPTGLFCSEIDISANIGPAWGDIHIGISSLEELDTYMIGLSELFQTQGLQGDRISYYISSSHLDETENIPSGLTACVIDNTIWLVQVSTQYQENTPTLRDFVENYGLPDAITWSEFPQTRIAFWFEHGIMAEINIDTSVETIDFGEILSIVYFPYQDSEGFEERWPYNRTRLTPPFSGDVVQNPPLPTEQNPIDFDVMMATITAEPSPTPIATSMPRSVN